MCSASNPNSSLPDLFSQQLRLHTLAVAYMVAISQNWLLLLTNSPQKRRIRTPLLTLQAQSRKLTPRPQSDVPRRELWLVK